MDRERLLYLLQRCIADKATREEEQELFGCLEVPASDKTLTNFVEERWDDFPLKITFRVMPDEDFAWDKMWADIQAATTQQPQEHFIKKR
jgi:hypothetical protein